MGLRKKTHEKDSEYTFVLMGITRKGLIYIKSIYEDNPESSVQKRRCEYSPKTLNMIDAVWDQSERRERGDFDTLFICHTHPDRGFWYANFSLGDLNGMIKDYKRNLRFQGKDIAYGMLTGDGKFITAFYDPKLGNIFRLTSPRVSKYGKMTSWDEFVRTGRVIPEDEPR